MNELDYENLPYVLNRRNGASIEGSGSRDDLTTYYSEPERLLVERIHEQHGGGWVKFSGIYLPTSISYDVREMAIHELAWTFAHLGAETVCDIVAYGSRLAAHSFLDAWQVHLMLSRYQLPDVVNYPEEPPPVTMEGRIALPRDVLQAYLETLNIALPLWYAFTVLTTEREEFTYSNAVFTGEALEMLGLANALLKGFQR
ncbi:MAG TPA: hypothetical protein VEA59_04990 [Patescibacteria group bacterium]|nr:hypothetical protein [Patescibacteria group bacterium]